jgi:hypothetical protein
MQWEQATPYSRLVGEQRGGEAPSFKIVSAGFAGWAGRLRSKLSLHFSPVMGAAHRRKVKNSLNCIDEIDAIQ